MILLERPISLEYHDTLNPLLFNHDTLKPEVRSKLLKFADEFRIFCGIDAKMIHDILATGSNYNYNYNDNSDIDVHIVIDRILSPNIPQDYYDDKKKVWAVLHHVTCMGIPVEPYVQDVSEKFPKDQGSYSLENNVWVQAPTNKHLNFKNDPYIEKKADFYEDLVDEMIKNKTAMADFMVLRRKFKDMRSAGLERYGEFSTKNQVFKELRNRKVFDRMNTYMTNYYDKDLSD